ncbi:MAG: zinc ribbon domain-containing protein [Candidatus Aenigmarchaeota archaeon]|nr:zinc ribbon domain-containing protein [Candidatus Aenigmarchaeota archaeon]
MGLAKAARYYLAGVLVMAVGLMVAFFYEFQGSFFFYSMWIVAFGLAIAGLGAIKGRGSIKTERVDDTFSVDSTRIIEMAGRVEPGTYKSLMSHESAGRKHDKGKLKCPKCEELLSRLAHFCDTCGLKLRNECAKCGMLNKPLARFCFSCGKRMV